MIRPSEPPTSEIHSIFILKFVQFLEWLKKYKIFSTFNISIMKVLTTKTFYYNIFLIFGSLKEF